MLSLIHQWEEDPIFCPPEETLESRVGLRDGLDEHTVRITCYWDVFCRASNYKTRLYILHHSQPWLWIDFPDLLFSPSSFYSERINFLFHELLVLLLSFHIPVSLKWSCFFIDNYDFSVALLVSTHLYYHWLWSSSSHLSSSLVPVRNLRSTLDNLLHNWHLTGKLSCGCSGL